MLAKIISAIAGVLLEVVIKIIKRSGPVHTEGDSFGNIEKKLRDKAKKDGWDV